MEIHPATLEDVVRLRLPVSRDERGESVKTFSTEGFSQKGLHDRWNQTLVVRNRLRGTLRGMHWQTDPCPEYKLVTCLRGRIFDVLIDVRRGSRTFGSWEGFYLDGGTNETLLIPPGMAHGYLTMEDESDLLYQIDGEYSPDLQRVLRWDDSQLNIAWPFAPRVISPRDAEAPGWNDLLQSRDV